MQAAAIGALPFKTLFPALFVLLHLYGAQERFFMMKNNNFSL